nr:uncharacterized protein LOC109157055 [Ipomoea batatas]
MGALKRSPISYLEKAGPEEYICNSVHMLGSGKPIMKLVSWQDEVAASFEAMAWRAPTTNMVRPLVTTNPVLQDEEGENLGGSTYTNLIPASTSTAAIFDPNDRTNPLYLHPNESPSLQLNSHGQQPANLVLPSENISYLDTDEQIPTPTTINVSPAVQSMAPGQFLFLFVCSFRQNVGSAPRSYSGLPCRGKIRITGRMKGLIFGGTSIDFLRLIFILESNNFTPLPQQVGSERSPTITLKVYKPGDGLKACPSNRKARAHAWKSRTGKPIWCDQCGQGHARRWFRKSV